MFGLKSNGMKKKTVLKIRLISSSVIGGRVLLLFYKYADKQGFGGLKKMTKIVADCYSLSK